MLLRASQFSLQTYCNHRYSLAPQKKKNHQQKSVQGPWFFFWISSELCLLFRLIPSTEYLAQWALHESLGNHEITATSSDTSVLTEMIIYYIPHTMHYYLSEGKRPPWSEFFQSNILFGLVFFKGKLSNPGFGVVPLELTKNKQNPNQNPPSNQWV